MFFQYHDYIYGIIRENKQFIWDKSMSQVFSFNSLLIWCLPLHTISWTRITMDWLQRLVCTQLLRYMQSTSLFLVAVFHFSFLSQTGGERLVRAYCQDYGISSVGVRPFSVYGPWGRPDGDIYRMALQISKGEKVEVYSNKEWVHLHVKFVLHYIEWRCTWSHKHDCLIVTDC